MRRPRRTPTRRGGSSSAARARRGTGRRRRRSTPASRGRAPRRGPRPRTAGAARRGARVGRDERGPGSARPPRVRVRRGAWRSPRRRRGGRRSGARGHRRSRGPSRDTDPRRKSPRSGPSAGRGSRRARARARRRAPIACIRRRITVATASTSSGSNAAAAPIDCWNDVAPRASRPWRVSSWSSAGMPSRVSSTRKRWISLPSSAASRASRFVAPATRLTWPNPFARRVRTRSGSSSVSLRNSSNDQREPSWASFSSSVIRASRSATRASIGRLGSW